MQSEYIEYEQSGYGLISGYTYKDGDQIFTLTPSYSIDGYVDLGLTLDMVLDDDLLGNPARETAATISLGFTILKQDHFLPFSLLMQLGLNYLSENSDVYEQESIITSGTGFCIGGKVFRYWNVAPRLYARTGFEVHQRMDTLIVEQMDSSSSISLPMSCTRNCFEYGAFAGVTWRPNTPNHGIAASTDIVVKQTLEGCLSVSGVFAITVIDQKS